MSPLQNYSWFIDFPNAPLLYKPCTNHFTRYTHPLTHKVFGRVESCPHFYTAYLLTNSLIFSLHASGFGVSIDNIYCGAPMYADVLALVAGSLEDLQATLAIVHNYAQKWRYNLNADKSVVMVLGETSCTRKSASSARKWTLVMRCLKR